MTPNSSSESDQSPISEAERDIPPDTGDIVRVRFDPKTGKPIIEARGWMGFILGVVAVVLTVALSFYGGDYNAKLSQLSGFDSRLTRIESTVDVRNSPAPLTVPPLTSQQRIEGDTITLNHIGVSPNSHTDGRTEKSNKIKPSTKWTFGGPYSFKANQQKVINFRFYEELKLSLTQVRALTSGLFKNSIERNKKNPKGSEFQRYNYVVSAKQDHLEFRVAVWDNSKIDRIAKLIPKEDFAIYREWLEEIKKSDKPVMVDFYPDEPFKKVEHSKHGPRRINIPFENGFRGFGLLDAVSKHFLLAQENPDVTRFLPESWLPTKVAYAGELLVDVKRMYYVLNANSGTYQPDGTYLEAVAGYLEQDKVLGVAPKYLQSFGTPVREYHSGTSHDLTNLKP